MSDVDKMALDIAKASLEVAKKIQEEVPRFGTPPSEGAVSLSEMVFPHSLVQRTRGYIGRVAYQINSSYEHGNFDACLVMLRRLIETLIIETFEANGIDDKIRDPNGNFLNLDDLITKAINEPLWNLSRDTKRILPHIKSLGDKAAHNRRFNAHRGDIDKITADIRTVVQELVYVAKFR